MKNTFLSNNYIKRKNHYDSPVTVSHRSQPKSTAGGSAKRGTLRV